MRILEHVNNNRGVFEDDLSGSLDNMSEAVGLEAKAKELEKAGILKSSVAKKDDVRLVFGTPFRTVGSFKLYEIEENKKEFVAKLLELEKKK